MTSKIVFTQDLPGEREWLEQQFPDHTMYETEFSGKWPDKPFNQSVPAVYEIPPDSLLNVSDLPIPKYKSLYKLDSKFVSPKWCQADQLLINNLNFAPQPKAKKAQVIHFARSGTVFLESILYQKCNYIKDIGWNPKTPHSDHHQLGGDDSLFYNLIDNSRPDIFFCYRKNWWDWFVSLQIALQFDYYHYYNNVAWDQLAPFEITSNHMEEQLNQITAGWNAICHFRTYYPNLNFYIFEFSDLIKHQSLTSHQKINYNKQRLISNYDSAKQMFEHEYVLKFDKCARNSLTHLQTMNCKIIKNFDGLLA